MDVFSVEHIKKGPLFKHICHDEILSVLTCLNASKTVYQEGEIIGIEGHEFTGLGVVLEGAIKIVKTNEAGEQVMMAMLGAGDVFGEMIAFSSVKQWPATVISHTEAVIIFIAPDRLIHQCGKMCQGHQQLITNLLYIISEKALALNRKVSYLSIKSMRGKIAKFLIEEYQKKEKGTFDIQFNRNELAEFLNVSRPSMSRELSRMKEEGLLDYYQNTFRIIDVQSMRHYASKLYK